MDSGWPRKLVITLTVSMLRHEIRLNVRGIVTDNHSANVNAFSALKNIQFRIKLLYKASGKQ